MRRNCFNSIGFSKLINLDINEQNLNDKLDLNFFVRHTKNNYKNYGRVMDFFRTPVCLSGPHSSDEIRAAIQAFESFENFGGAYLQSRCTDWNLFDYRFATTKGILGYRTGYYLRNNWSFPKWFSLMKRDSRDRFKKAIRTFTEGKITTEQYYFEDVIQDSIVAEVTDLYSSTALQKSFSDVYRFKRSGFSSLLNDRNWHLQLIREGRQLLGFSIIGDTGIELDYTLAVTVDNKLDLSRLLIYFAFLLAQSEKKDLCLGGGIIENDALSDFKSRMGAEPVKLVNYKLISQNLLRYVGFEEFILYNSKRWPDEYN